jgi:hypothetical protein
MSNRTFLLAGLALVAYVASWFIWQLLDQAPLAWSAVLWAGVFAVYFRAAVGGAHRHHWLSGVAALLAVASVEGYLWIQRAHSDYVVPPGVTLEGSYAKPGFFFEIPEKVLGYRPRPGVRAEAIKKYLGKLVYDVTYTVGTDGLRITPRPVSETETCVFYFGDSFAWGEGVADEQTAAYQNALLGAGQYRLFNFAVTGYGPHQMLTQLETGIVKKVAAACVGKQVFAVYQTLPNNVGRVAGLGAWDRWGPRYVLSQAGEVVHRGRFDEGDSVANDRLFVSRRALRWLGKIQLYTRTLGRERKPNDFDYDRFAAVVAASFRELGRQFPGARAQVLLWDDLAQRTTRPGSEAWRVREALVRREVVDVRLIEDVLPDYVRGWNRYHLDNDMHPTPAAHRLVAAYLHSQFVAPRVGVLAN